MVAAIFLALVYAVLALCIVFAVLGGKKLGLFGVLLRVGVVMLSTVISFFIVKLISPLLLDFELSLCSTLGLPSDLVSVLSSGAGMRVLASILSKGLVSPILFTLLSVILTVIGTVIVHFTARKLPQGSKGGGMGVGALYGLILAIVILFPLLSTEGILDTAVEKSPVIKEKLEAMLGEDAVDGLENASSANLAHLLLGKNVIKWTVQGMSAEEVGDTKADVYDAVEDICDVVEAAKAAFSEKGLDFLSMTEEERAGVTEMLNKVDKSPLLSSAFPEIVSALAEKWSEGETFMGMSAPGSGSESVMTPVYRQMFDSIAKSDREDVIGNLEVTLDAMSKWATADEAELFDVVNEVLETLLGGSEELQDVATEIKLTGMKVVMQDMIPALKDEEKYDAAVDDMLGLVEGDGATVESVSDGLEEILLEHDYTLSEEKLDSAAEVLVDRRNELGRALTEEELADLYFEHKDLLQ